MHRSVDHQGVIPLKHLTKYGLGDQNSLHSSNITPLPNIDGAEDPMSIYQNTQETVNVDDKEILQSNLNSIVPKY